MEQTEHRLAHSGRRDSTSAVLLASFLLNVNLVSGHPVYDGPVLTGLTTYTTSPSSNPRPTPTATATATTATTTAAPTGEAGASTTAQAQHLDAREGPVVDHYALELGAKAQPTGRLWN